MRQTVPTIRTEPIALPRGARRCGSSYYYGGLAGAQCARERGHDGPHESKSIGFTYAGYRWTETGLIGAQTLIAEVFNY